MKTTRFDEYLVFYETHYIWWCTWVGSTDPAKQLYTVVHFLCLPKENEPKERAPSHLSACCGCSEFMPLDGAPQSCREFENSLRSDSSNSFLGNFCGARLRDNGGRATHLRCNVAPFRGLPDANCYAGGDLNCSRGALEIVIK